ncbi:54S ribosomal protein img2, mitochondrial [Exophiala xenobiotica]|uniref:Large ribosomal subunit protein mL49 n=1 Tax=Lithohypha guttulata TaxID=1690604 RepID=A0ABR0KKU5_9EURO|nr:54S ribosomal protein img2, mitochondrial [Lithohypha guttulata]KAK5328254.1 54S ribosomal protein img2, mitochondrial [Exophiala xenobiotica]
MSRIPVPSINLLRTFLRPTTSSCTICQIRSTSTFMPRHQYAKVNRLDKLHRAQKKALKQEKEESHLRATLLVEEMKSSAGAISAAALPFHIGRTKSKNLAIYETTKAGGSKHITQIRRLAGDLEVLQQQLRDVLKLPDIIVDGKGRKKEPVAINPLTQQIIIRGWRGPEVKKWAETLGF